MKWKMGRWVGSAAMAVAAGAALTLLAPATAQAQTGIANTKHNLGSGAGPAGRNQVGDTAEICVFCHTPHGADTSAAAPLWNKKLPSGSGYQTYSTANSSTIDGEVLSSVGSVSLACLSCHDGTQAMDNIINAPGSGQYDATGGGPDGRAWGWGASPRVDSTGKLTGVAALGTDLRDDHPIGIEYCGGGLSGTTANVSAALATGTCKDSDFRQPYSATINSQGVWWVETGTGDTKRTRTDMILYSRAFAGGNGPSVECASCHDPHVSEGQAGPNSQVAGATFLRVSNAGSAVCLACHVK